MGQSSFSRFTLAHEVGAEHHVLTDVGGQGQAVQAHAGVVVLFILTTNRDGVRGQVCAGRDGLGERVLVAARRVRVGVIRGGDEQGTEVVVLKDDVQATLGEHLAGDGIVSAHAAHVGAGQEVEAVAERLVVHFTEILGAVGGAVSRLFVLN